MSLLSGKIGTPDGAYTLLNRGDAERALSWLIQNQQQIQDTIDSPGGTGNAVSGRFASDGTTIFADGMSCSRTTTGVYAITLTTAVAGSGTSAQMAVTVTPSTVANGEGGGPLTYSAFSADTFENTDNNNGNRMGYSAQEDSFIVLGRNDDKLYVHDLPGFGDGATLIDTSAYPINYPGSPSGLGWDGVISKGGEYAVLSYDGSTNYLRVIDLSDGTIYTFTSLSDANGALALAARVESGTLYVWLYRGADTKAYKYPCTLGGTPSLGTSTLTYNDLPANIHPLPSGSSTAHPKPDTSRGVWTSDNFVWFLEAGHLWQMDPDRNEIVRHGYPITQGGGGTDCSEDTLNGHLYCCIQSNITSAYSIWRFKGWNADRVIQDSGTWEHFADVGSTQFTLYADYASRVLFVVENGTANIYRYHMDTKELIDTVNVSAITGTGTLNLCLARYEHPYGYGSITQSGQEKIFRLTYSGSAISSGTLAAPNPAGALNCLYTVNSPTSITVSLYRKTEPLTLWDGEFSIAVHS